MTDLWAELAKLGPFVVTTLLVHEPQRLVAEVAVRREQRVIDWIAARAHWPQWAQSAGAW